MIEILRLLFPMINSELSGLIGQLDSDGVTALVKLCRKGFDGSNIQFDEIEKAMDKVKPVFFVSVIVRRENDETYYQLMRP